MLNEAFSLVVGILFLLQLSNASPFVNTNLNWTIPYFSLSLAINLFVTIAVVARLYMLRRRIALVLGRNHGSQYTSVAAMIVESASLYSIFSICFLVPFGRNSSIASVFLQTIGQVQAVATLMIIYRVASGNAWSAHTQHTLMETMEAPLQPGQDFQLESRSKADPDSKSMGADSSKDADSSRV